MRNSEWMMEISGVANEFVQGEDGLTWAQVDTAIGASKFNLGRTKRVKFTQLSSTSPTRRGCGRGHGRGHARGRGNIV